MALAVVILIGPEADACVVAHERKHIRDQWRGLLIGWAILYAVHAARGLRGRDHPLEKAAYQIEDRCREATFTRR